MAINSVKQISAGRRGSGKVDSRSYVVVWFVLVDDPWDGPCTVGNARGIPLRFAPYVGYENTSDPAALCTDVIPEPDGGEGEYRRWRVTATFSTDWNQNQQPQNDDPEDDPPIFWVETEFQEVPTTKEANGDAIVNKAEDLIEGITRIDAVETWVWEKNYNAIDRETWSEYQNTINSEPFFELEKYQGLLHIIVPKPSYRNGVPYYRVQWRVKTNLEEDGWNVRPANRGFRVKVISPGGQVTWERPKDDKNRPFDGEVWLKNDGTQERDTTAAKIYLPAKKLYRQKDHNDLGLT